MSGAAGAPRRSAAALALLLVAGCAPTVLRHRVQPGENLFRIGKAYGVSYQELARRNHISDPDRIEVGAIVVIPHATRELPVDVITPDQARADQPLARELPAGPTPFIWPVTGAIASPFGPRGDGHHDGIDISCAEGTPVRAARGGRVLYADTLRGYGNLVIVAHDQGYATVYAHNRMNRVKAGDVVRQGEVVAVAGETGKTEGPNLHFEVRQQNVAPHPPSYLPPLAPTGGGAPAGAPVVQKGT